MDAKDAELFNDSLGRCSRTPELRPELYDLCLDCLLQAVQRFDPSFDEDVERVWRLGLGTGIAFMKSRY